MLYAAASDSVGWCLEAAFEADLFSSLNVHYSFPVDGLP